MVRTPAPAAMLRLFSLLNSGRVMMRFLFPLFSGIALFYVQCVGAWEVTCPIFIETEPSVAVLKSPQGQWRVSPRHEPRLWLTHVDVTQDKPEKFGDQKPEMEKVRDKTWLIWQMGDATGKESDRYWFSCVYNDGQVWLSQSIPVSSKVCKTRYFDEPPRERPVSLTCN